MGARCWQGRVRVRHSGKRADQIARRFAVTLRRREKYSPPALLHHPRCARENRVVFPESKCVSSVAARCPPALDPMIPMRFASIHHRRASRNLSLGKKGASVDLSASPAPDVLSGQSGLGVCGPSRVITLGAPCASPCFARKRALFSKASPPQKGARAVANRPAVFFRQCSRSRMESTSQGCQPGWLRW